MQVAGALPNVELNKKPQIKNANYNFVKKSMLVPIEISWH